MRGLGGTPRHDREGRRAERGRVDEGPRLTLADDLDVAPQLDRSLTDPARTGDARAGRTPMAPRTPRPGGSALHRVAQRTIAVVHEPSNESSVGVDHERGRGRLAPTMRRGGDEERSDQHGARAQHTEGRSRARCYRRAEQRGPDLKKRHLSYDAWVALDIDEESPLATTLPPVPPRPDLATRGVAAAARAARADARGGSRGG